MMIRTSIVIAAILLTCHAADAQTDAARFIRPTELAKLVHSFGVVFPTGARAVEVTATATRARWEGDAIEGTGRPADTLQSQLEQALTNLNGALGRLQATSADVVRLHVNFVGERFEQVFLINEVLVKFSLGPAVRTELGVHALDDPGHLVEVRAIVLNQAKPPEAGGIRGRTILIGGVTALQRNWTVKGVGNAGAQLTAALANMEIVLAQAGATRADVRQVRLFYVPAAGNPDLPASLTRALESYFGPSAPVIAVRDIRAVGTAAEKLLIEVDAVVGESGDPQSKEPRP